MKDIAYEMRKIKSNWVANRFSLIREHIGWSFFPITYNGCQYVIEFVIHSNVAKIEDVKFICNIYEYGIENKLLRKHRRNRVYNDDCTIISISDDKLIDMRKLNMRETEEKLKMYLPQIMSNIFHSYELEKKERANIIEKISATKKWDGVIR